MTDLPNTIHRDSLEWLAMMAEYGPEDCRPMMVQLHMEISLLRSMVANKAPDCRLLQYIEHTKGGGPD